MAKFDEEAWRKRNEREQEEEAARRSMADYGSDAELRRELTEMFGTSDFDAIVQAVADDSGLSKKDVAAMKDAARRAQRALKKGNVHDAEQLVMGDRGLREVRKRSGKGCAVIALAMLGSASLSIWGLVEAAGRLLG